MRYGGREGLDLTTEEWQTVKGMGDGGGKSVPDNHIGRKYRAEERAQYSKCSTTNHRCGIRKI